MSNVSPPGDAAAAHRGLIQPAKAQVEQRDTRERRPRRAMAPSLLDGSPPGPTYSRNRPVRAQKNIVWKMAMATVAIVCIAWPSQADAQARRYPGARTRVVLAGGYFYDPFWYDPWYGGFAGPWGWYPPYRYYNVGPESAIRFDVKPNNAEVYVDGYYAGIVDDFDGP